MCSQKRHVNIAYCIIDAMCTTFQVQLETGLRLHDMIYKYICIYA